MVLQKEEKEYVGQEEPGNLILNKMYNYIKMIISNTSQPQG